jgi:acetyl esterase/lipase
MPEIRPEIGAYRKFLADMKPTIEARVGGPIAGVAEADHDVPTSDGSSIVIRSYTPDQASPKGSPLIVMYHGGGFCIGDLLTLTPLCRTLAAKLGAVVLNVAYRLAPENPFPIPIYDSWDALQWVCLDALNAFCVVC